jgi:Holliday junction resolvase RusA-like endonuclease
MDARAILAASQHMTTPTAEQDHARCIRLLGALCPDQDEYRVLTIAGEPRSKARPRFGGNGRVYTPRKQVEAEALLGWHFRRAFREPLSGNLAVVCLFFRSTHGRVDVDNMLKHVMDAANTIVWHDDYQVTGMVGAVDLDRERPRTVIGIARHVSTMTRDGIPERTCAHCGKAFAVQAHTSKQATCSRSCAVLLRGGVRRAPRECAQCRVVFQPTGKGQEFCGNECRLAALHARHATPDRRTCVDCGTRLPSATARRCRACWRASQQPAGV